MHNPTMEADLVSSARRGTLPISLMALLTAILILRVATVAPLIVYLIVNKAHGWTIFWDGLVICTILLHAMSFVLVELPTLARVVL